MPSLNASITELLRHLKVELYELYGPRLRGLYLFGSYARGEPDAESDVDVLIVLDRIDHYGAEVDRTGEIASSLSLAYGVSLSRVFISEDVWATGQSPFLHNVREEVVAA